MSVRQAVKSASRQEEAQFEPKIIAYLCTWCSYTGADTAGIARLRSPANIRAIRVPCSGRVSPELIMRTFEQGADGVLVLGCHIGECHYDSGNHRTAKRLPILQSLLAFAGLEPERLRLDWVSASEGERFARITGEFAQTVRALGPTAWRLPPEDWPGLRPVRQPKQIEPAHSPSGEMAACPPERCQVYTRALREKAHTLLTSGAVSCVIGYEESERGRARPVFIHHTKDVDRLVWNPDCTQNLVTYLGHKLRQGNGGKGAPVAVVVKPCDSKAINVLLAEGRFQRDQVHVIGMACEGIYDRQAEGPVIPLEAPQERIAHTPLQRRCQRCEERTPVVYDTLIGDISQAPAAPRQAAQTPLAALEALSPAQRMEYWLNQFDRCIRCYACRQACPMCDCPTCLYERDDSLWAGMGVGLNEKRAFHLGRAYHLAGRCVGCDECERACPMEIPISLLNLRLAQEVQRRFGYRAGLAPTPSPFVTVLGGEEA